MAKFQNRLKQLKAEVVDIGKLMYQHNFSAPTDGNVSFLHNDFIYITKSNKSKNDLTVNDLIKCNRQGNAVGVGKPSTEMALHRVVYDNRKDINAVVHAHPPFATAFAVAHLPLELNSMSETVTTLGAIPLAEYGTPSTDELPNSILPYVESCNAILLANHGVITYGETLTDAWYNMERVEHYARISYYARQIGGEVEISQHNVNRLVKLRHEFYKIKSPQRIKPSKA